MVISNRDDIVLTELKRGRVPSDTQVLKQITAGTEILLDILVERYFQGYIRLGGSKVKFIVGKEGAGKTHHLKFMHSSAAEIGYYPVQIDARKIKLQRIDDLYRQIVGNVDLPALLQSYCTKIAEEVAEQKLELPQNKDTLFTVLARQLDSAPIAGRRLKDKLTELLRNPDLNRYFGIAMMHLAQDALGMRSLQVADRANLYSWLLGTKVTASSLRPFQIFTKLDRYNGRHMLRSLFSFIRLAGYCGCLVSIDSLETVVEDNPETKRAMYSRVARDDTYEMIRQLIDEADDFESTLFLFATRPSFFIDSVRGVKSYYALWMRIQEEVVTRRFNGLSDQVSLDKVFDPPSPDSPEEKLLKAIFGDTASTDTALPTSDEKVAVGVLEEMSARIARLDSRSALPQDSILSIVRKKVPISPVKRTVLATLG